MSFKSKKHLPKALSLIMVFILFTALVFNFNHIDANAKGKKSSSSRVQVKGYHRKDGTYVRPHVRTYPDGIKSNNLPKEERLDPIKHESSSRDTIYTDIDSDIDTYTYTNMDINSKIRKLKSTGKISVSNYNIKNKNITIKNKNYVTIGSTKDEVRNIQGEPKFIFTSYKPCWVYNHSYIYFDNNGKVIEWDNNGDLDVFLGEQKENDTSNIIKGDSFKKVIDNMGTPDRLNFYTSFFITIYDFEYTSIHIYFDKNGKVEFIS